MWVYNLLDVLSTIVEATIFYVITLCFCRTCRFQKVISRIVPPAVFAIAVIIMTFFVDVGAYRIFIVLAMMVVFTLICYKVSIHNAVIVMELAYLLITPLSKATGISIMSLLYQGDIMTQVDGVSILKWQIYVFAILLKALYAIIAYHLLKNFKYEIQAKDTAVLSVSFLLVFAVSFASTYGYLNLGESDTLILDVVTSVLGVVFIVQFLYSRNVSYLREQEQRVILIKAGQVQDFVSILIENNCADEVHADGHTTKGDKFLHGFGISNMKKAAEKYSGICTTTQANGKFTLKILLPLPAGKAVD